MSNFGWNYDAIFPVIAVVTWSNFVKRRVFTHGCELRDDMLAMWSMPSEKGSGEMYQVYLDKLEIEEDNNP